MSVEGELFALRFQDELAQEEVRKFTVTTPGAYLAPHSIERRIPANLRQVSADVIMVTPQAFRERLQPLADLRREQGWRVAVTTISARKAGRRTMSETCLLSGRTSCSGICFAVWGWKLRLQEQLRSRGRQLGAAL